MAIKELKGNGKIVVARTEIYVPHLKEVLAFGLPMFGPGTYNNVMAQVSQEGLRPTTAQTLSLVDLALQNQDEEHCRDILTNLKNRHSWSATENLWDEEDVIVYDNVDGKMPSDRKSLIKRHKDGDKAVRVVKYGFKTETQSINEFLKNPFVIAQIGDKDLIDVVQRVTRRLSKNQPCVWALGPQNSDTKSYSALYSDLDDNRLNLDGSYGDDNSGGGGYASPVRVVKKDKEGERVA